MDQNIMSNSMFMKSNFVSNSIAKPPVPSVKDFIKIPNTSCINPFIPTVNHTVTLSAPSNQFSTNSSKLNKSVEVEKSHINTKGKETKLYIEKKKKERAEKKKVDFLKKQKFVEERKKKLAELQKTTRELAKASNKKKTILHNDHQDESEISLNLSTKSNRPEVDQTWSPPPKIKSLNKTVKTPFGAHKKSIKDLEEMCSDNIHLSIKKNDSIIYLSTPKKIFQSDTSTPQKNLIEKEPSSNIKSNSICSSLKLDDDYQLIDNNSFDFSIVKLVTTDTSSVQNNHKNVNHVEKDSVVNIDPAMKTDLHLSNQSYKEITNSIDNSEIQKLLLNQCSPIKTCCTESTQTNGHENLVSFFPSKIQPPPLNFISVLKCKNNLRKKDNVDLEFSKTETNLKINNLNPKKCLDNIESLVYNDLLEAVDYNKSLDFQNVNPISKENVLNKNEYELNAETTKLEPYGQSLVETYESDVSEVKSNLNNSKLFLESNMITNRDIKQELKNLSYHFDSSTKNTNDFHGTNTSSKCVTNNSISITSPEIHNEFQAELNIIDQLNDSLHDIEKMSCTMSTRTNDSIDYDLYDPSISNDVSSKVILNTVFTNKNKPTSVTKLNALSSNMITVDKTITSFSIQMFEQLIKDEELRAKQHHTILNLREKSLMNRLKWEVSICELQIKSMKNQPGHEKHLQTFKQKQRGSVKKLEHSLSQVKRLGRVIDSVYNKRLIMLKEHLQYLRTQSSSKNVIRKLKSLDQIPKKDESTCVSHHFNSFKQHDKTNFIDTSENTKEYVILNPYELNVLSKNNSLQTGMEHKSNIVLQNQATSPTHTKARSFKKVESIQTDDDRSLHPSLNKFTQTSKSFCNYVNNENKLSKIKNPINNKSEVVLSSSSTKTKQYISETSYSTNSEQSDMELRITTLQEQLEARKIEMFMIKKEQKKLRLENLKSKEQDLLKQIELYDKKIEESKKSLMVDIEKKNIQTKHEFFSKHSSYSNLQNLTRNDINLTSSTNNCDLEDIDNFNKRKTSEVALPIEISEANVKTLKKSDEIIKTEISGSFLKSQSSNDLFESLNEETQSNKLSVIVNTNSHFPNQRLNVSNNNEDMYLEKTTNNEKLPISGNDINKEISNFSSSFSSDIQNKLPENFNETDNACNNCENDINPLNISNFEIGIDHEYSLDFTPHKNTLECPKSNELNNYDNVIAELRGKEKNDESSSYEEERSEGEVMFDDKTFIEQFSDDGYYIHNEKIVSDEVDVITNNIFNCLLKEIKITLKSDTNKKKVHSEKNDLDNLTEDTPLLLILKREEEHQHIVFLSEQARTISSVLLNRNLHTILSEILPVYLSRLNELQLEKLKLYLNWTSSKRKKLKIPSCLSIQHKTNDVDEAESFEIFYQNYQDQKKSSTPQDENSDVMLSKTQQEANKLKLEQLRIEEEIERLRITEKTQFVHRNIPKKPPPPYKSPTKKKSLADVPYTPDEIYKIVLTAASQLFNGSQLSMSNEYIIESDSCLHPDYKTLIFDFCKEVAQETVIDETNVPIWKKNRKRLKNFRSRPNNPNDLSDTVLKKINQILDIDECEEKVNKFVVKQMHEEDSKWFDFQMDEMDIQNDIVESLMQKLLCDTITNVKTSFYFKF